ncbi:hypothetical protein OEZ86_004158 [Tetradesmus obliquus]|uniref:Uncharacterized protein n=2 Tax=Tetradesmus obliquus TaxID=3088 RepID=A0ABY8U6E8_TETOB|nr:hypothetical protein OEZ85_002187 [Tetradesmus obliquus]WIA35763.1 hypothetical protein OEZ86_004158 [Tetradesmus obliquus]|eukprot:jgi/Sobl393_1/3403/SZX68925.1
MIFEARYRVLFNTLLAGAEKVEEGLVQEDSPFAGSRRFGMCFADDVGRISGIGTTLEIQDFLIESSGRMYVTNKGIERFKVTKVVKQQPVLVCEVEVLPEDDDQSDEAKALAAQVADLFRNVLRLHLKIARAKLRPGASRGSSAAAEPLNSEAEDEVIEAMELTESSPSQLSYWIAHAFSDSRLTQQTLLEVNKTMERLQEEKALLEGTLKYYSAATALEGVFGGGSGSSSASSTEGAKGASSSEVQPPPGGPD